MIILKYIVFLIITVRADHPAQIMKAISIAFGQEVHHCRNWVVFTEDVIMHFLNYWSKNQRLVNTDAGCVVICVANRLQIVDEDGQLLPDNAEKFVISNGGDAEMAKELLDIYRACQHQVIQQHLNNYCKIGLRFFECFRALVRDLGWAPDISDFQVSNSISIWRRKYTDVDVFDDDSLEAVTIPMVPNVANNTGVPIMTTSRSKEPVTTEDDSKQKKKYSTYLDKSQKVSNENTAAVVTADLKSYKKYTRESVITTKTETIRLSHKKNVSQDDTTKPMRLEQEFLMSSDAMTKESTS